METVTSPDGTKIAYDKLGEGPPLVMVTGASCFRRFLPVASDAKALAKHFTVYNYDRRGRGDSTDAGSWSIDREVDDIEALIEAAGGEALVYGHSSGAVLALEAGRRLHDKLAKVAAYDASYVHGDQERVEYAALGEEVDRLLEAGANGKAMRRFLTGIGMPRAFVAMLPAMPGWSTMKRLAPTLRYDIALTRDEPQREWLQALKVPTLLLVGGKGPATLRGTHTTLSSILPDARAMVVEGQDHMVSMKVLLPILTDFLTSE